MSLFREGVSEARELSLWCDGVAAALEVVLQNEGRSAEDRVAIAIDVVGALRRAIDVDTNPRLQLVARTFQPKPRAECAP